MEKYSCFNCDSKDTDRFSADTKAVVYCSECGCKLIRVQDGRRGDGGLHEKQ